MNINCKIILVENEWNNALFVEKKSSKSEKKVDAKLKLYTVPLKFMLKKANANATQHTGIC